MQKDLSTILRKKKPMLSKIIEYKKSVIEQKKSAVPVDILKSCTRRLPLRSILDKMAEKDFIIIAETKKASPSAGILRKRYNPAKIAISYQKSGASAISVLTEDKFFLGSVEHLKAVKNSVSIPVLAKDFFIDEYQIYEAYFQGADCILLILKILSDEQFVSFTKIAEDLGLETLIEVQNEDELRRFFNLSSGLSNIILGINNRNLENLNIDLNGTFHLLSLLNEVKIPTIIESGIESGKILAKFYSAKARGALIGTYLLKASSPGKALEKLLREMRNEREKNCLK